MNIEIVTVDNSELKETGFGAIGACNSVLASVRKLGHNASLNVCSTEEHLSEVARRRPDLVILAVKYMSIRDQDDIWLSDYFADQGINFSGSSRHVLKYDSSKVLAKTHLDKCSVKTAKFFTAIPGQYNSESTLPINFPLFLKPSDAANGNGVDDFSLVSNFAEFQEKVLSLYSTFGVPVLAEEYLSGREFTVAIIKTAFGKFIVSPVEIIPEESSNGMRILGERAKRENREEFNCLDDSELSWNVRRLAVEAFKELGVRDFGRIDIKANDLGQCFFMEANLVPGMTSMSSYFPRACEMARGLTYDKVVALIVDAGISRVPATGSIGPEPGSPDLVQLPAA
jgi:D-alanine-D-alanine ligase